MSGAPRRAAAGRHPLTSSAFVALSCCIRCIWNRDPCSVDQDGAKYPVGGSVSRFCFRRSGLRLHHRPDREIAVSAWRAKWRPASEKT